MPPPAPARLVGRAAVVACERTFHDATGGTLVVTIEAVTANDFFGTVTGTFHARFPPGPARMPFCRLWRFRDGLLVEHWQNPYDPARMRDLLTWGTN